MRNIYDSISKHICFVFKAYMIRFQNIYVSCSKHICFESKSRQEYLCKSIIPTNAVSSVLDW